MGKNKEKIEKRKCTNNVDDSVIVYRNGFRAILKPLYTRRMENVSPNNKMVNSYIYGTERKISPRNHLVMSDLTLLVEE